MSRFNFATDQSYAGRLIGIHQRPIENDQVLKLHLLRLEFEIYQQLSHAKPTLRSEGQIASRDLIIGQQIPPSKDAGQQVYASVLGIRGDLSQPESWLRALDRGVWIQIVFGPPESVGGRNPFRSISRFDRNEWRVEPYRFDLTQEWVGLKVAAHTVKVSESTIRRRVDELENVFGARLVRRTNGNQRRIYLPLFVNLWSNEH